MPSRLWANDDGTVSVVEVDELGNRIDAPKPEPVPEPEPPVETRKRGRPRKT